MQALRAISDEVRKQRSSLQSIEIRKKMLKMMQ